MNFPSLLFNNAEPDFSISHDVFDDIKLTSLLSDETVSLMRKPCDKEDILLRQEVFKSINYLYQKEKNGYNYLSILYDKMLNMTRLHRAFISAESENYRNVVYIGLIKCFVDFCIASSEKKINCYFFDCFSNAFQKICNSDSFKQIKDDVEVVLPKLKCFEQEVCHVSGIIQQITTIDIYSQKSPFKSGPKSKDENKVYFKDGKATSYISKLLKCAEELGLTEINVPDFSSEKISPGIIGAISKIHKDEFKIFENFYNRYDGKFEKGILKYSSQLRFYIDIIKLIDKVSDCNIPMNYPDVSSNPVIDVKDAYDISLLIKNEENIVPNDLSFDKNDPFFYLTGANGGGKTTYLRTLGIAVVLFLNGSPIPCKSAKIYPFKKVFTHFPRDERFDIDGRFEDEHKRVINITDFLDGNSLVLLNETYSTTAEDKALEYTKKLADKIQQSGDFGVYVTHHHFSEETNIPFLNVIVDVNNNNTRTYKVAKQNEIQNSFAYDILRKYRLTKDDLEKRFKKLI